MKVLIEYWTELDSNRQEVERWLYLESDDMQYTLKRYNGKVSVDKHGRETEQSETIGYFTNVQSALMKIMSMKIKQSTAATLDQLLIDIKRIEHEIKMRFSAELKDGSRVAV